MPQIEVKNVDFATDSNIIDEGDLDNPAFASELPDEDMLFIDEPPFLDDDGTQAYVDALETIRQRYPCLLYTSDEEAAKKWLAAGAQPTDVVAKILKDAGIEK